jgi:hypothetical protein
MCRKFASAGLGSSVIDCAMGVREKAATTFAWHGAHGCSAIAGRTEIKALVSAPRATLMSKVDRMRLVNYCFILLLALAIT